MQDERLKRSLEINDKLIDEIVDEVVASTTFTKRERTSTEDMTRKENLSETANLEERVAVLESKVEKYINSFKVVAVEVERLITEKTETLNEENQQQITYLQGQIENLRTALTRVSNEVKKIAEKPKY